MEYAYATMLLTEADEPIDESNLTAVLEAADVDVEESRVRALVAALEGVNLDSVPDEADDSVVGGIGLEGRDRTDEDDVDRAEADAG